MRIGDALSFAGNALYRGRTRSGLMLLAMAIGVGSVVVLTALGEGARRYVSDQFSAIGTHLLIVLPGRVETTGTVPPLVGGTPRDLTLDDARALERSSSIHMLAPLVVGSAPVSYRQLERETMILGSTAALQQVRNLHLERGRFLPPGDPERGAAMVVIGSTLKKELFGNRTALSHWLRIGDRRFRVIGVLQPMGESLGTNISDMAIIPVASAQSLFNTNALFRILIQARGQDTVQKARHDIIHIIRKRHDDEEDFTVITQDALLSTFNRIFRALTYTVSGIAAISLTVAGILIMNVMLISVSQRTAEIGLLKALGSRQREILGLFLVEAGILSAGGAILGSLAGLIGVMTLGWLFPDFPLAISLWSLAGASVLALIIGVLFGVIPARRAARLNPVQALR